MKMESADQARATACLLCGFNYSLPEDDVEGTLPRVLLCGHSYCLSCLRPMEYNNAITCPQCEVVCSLPEAGVDGLTEDCRMIGLLYTAKMNKKRSHRSSRRTRSRNRWRLPQSVCPLQEDNTDYPEDLKKFELELDKALVQAAENLARLENVHQTLKTGLTKQVTRERGRLQFEISQVTTKAIHSIHMWKDLQLGKLSTLESHFIQTVSQLQQVEERVSSLQLAIQKAREVRRVPFLEQYCSLDKVLETLQAPVDHQLDLTCLSEVSGLRCALNARTVNHSLMLSLDFKNQNKANPNPSRQARPAEGGMNRMSDEPKSQLDSSPGSRSPSSAGSCHSSTSDLAPDAAPAPVATPDIIIEEIMEDMLQHVTIPPTGPQLANEKKKSRRRKSSSTGYTRSVVQWVVVTHILNPNHFYVQYVAEKRESEVLSRRINYFCLKSSSSLYVRHTLDTGSLIFVKYEDGLWHRARVVNVSQVGYPWVVKSCPVTQISSVKVFFIDSGLTTAITIKSEDRESDALLKTVNNYLRRMVDEARAELDSIAPQAIRCSLKDLVPYDQTKGWSKQAQTEFRSMVDSTAVKMQTLGQDKDSLLVDLKKVPVNRASGPHISVREHLVFIEVARFYSPMTVSKKPLLYHPSVTPRTYTELNAVVSHIHTPGDFYIQLVDNMESLLLSDKLQKYYNSPLESEDLNIYCPVIGDACVALFEDKMWYRAQITGHPGCRKVEVLYVDFGNKEILPVTDLRKIRDEFFALPAMAICCCLSDVVPLDLMNWSEACSSLFISLANHKLVTVVATAKGPRHGPIPVKLFESGLNGPVDNIGEKLVKEELAVFRHGSSRWSCEDSSIWDPPLELDSGDVSAAGDEFNSTEFQPQLRLPTKLKDVKVQVSHANSPSSFYVQFTKYDSLLKRVCELLKQECSHREPEDVQWKAGMYCAAHIKGVWERAQLCSDVLSNNIAEVIRCDHGDKAKMHLNSLLPLPSELEGSLALECTLCDIRPAGGRSTWTGTACDFISYYLSGASALLTAKEVSEERPVAVTLSCSNSTGQLISIADSLVSQGLALRKRKPQSDISSPDSENPKDAEATHTKTVPNGRDGDGDSSTPCTPTTSSTLSTPSALDSLSTPSALDSLCTPSALDSLSTPSALDSLSTPSALDSLSTPSALDSLSTPSALDSLSTPSALDSLSTPSALDSLSTPSALDSLSTPSALDSLSTPSALDSLSTPGALNALSAPFTPGLLYTPSFPGSTSLQTGARPTPSPRTFGTTEMIKTQLYEAPELPCPGHMLMTVSAIGEDGTIYARTETAERQFKVLKGRIQQSIKFNPCLKMYTWKTVQGCLINGADMLLYRGQRLEVLGGHIKVQYIDLGHVETIPVIHVQPWLLFEDIPQLCVPCQLHAISPVGGHWQRDAVALLTELLLNRTVDVHVLELPADARGPLTVDIFLDGISIRRIMSENHHGSLDQVFLSSPGTSLISPALLDDWDINTEGLLEEEMLLGSFIYPELPPEGEDFPVRVKHLRTPNELFLWPLEGMSDVEINGETLDEALDRVNASIESVPRLDCFLCGGPCLAEYSNGKYYRAKIMDISSVEPLCVLVQHVDFGSDDTLDTAKLRHIPPHLLLFPICALKVKVAGFKAPSVNRKEDMLPYSPEWSVRAAMNMIDLLHGCISATVVAREPELTVRLYDDDGQPVHMPLVCSGLAELD